MAPFPSPSHPASQFQQSLQPEQQQQSQDQQQHPQQPRPALRRAIYVHVSDLINSYNINHTRLEQELARVKAEEGDGPAKAVALPATAEDPHADADIEHHHHQHQHHQRKLQPPRGGYNLCVLVGKVRLVVDKRRVDGSRVRLAEVQIGDETGTVSLRARDDQIDTLTEITSRPNGAVVLRNCTLELYQGKHIRLAVTKWGKLTPYPDDVPSTPPPPSKMNTDRNFSLIDLSAVASEMAELQSTSAHQRQEAGYHRGSRQTPEESEGATASAAGSGGRRQYQQSHSSTRRGSRGSGGGGGTMGGGADRRQSRQKPGGGGAARTTYYHHPADTGLQQIHQPQQQQHQMYRFQQQVHGYAAGYDPSLMMRQYPPFQPGSRDMPQISAHQLMMQQQYEIQQRQMQQMYQERTHQHLHQHQHQQQQPTQQHFQPHGTSATAASSTATGTSPDDYAAAYTAATAYQHAAVAVAANPHHGLGMVSPSPASPPRTTATASSEEQQQQIHFPGLRAASPYSPSLQSSVFTLPPQATYIHPSATSPQMPQQQPYFPLPPSYPSTSTSATLAQTVPTSQPSAQQSQQQQPQEQQQQQQPTYASAVSGRGSSGVSKRSSTDRQKGERRHREDT